MVATSGGLSKRSQNTPLHNDSSGKIMEVFPSGGKMQFSQTDVGNNKFLKRYSRSYSNCGGLRSILMVLVFCSIWFICGNNGHRSNIGNFFKTNDDDEYDDLSTGGEMIPSGDGGTYLPLFSSKFIDTNVNMSNDSKEKSEEKDENTVIGKIVAGKNQRKGDDTISALSTLKDAPIIIPIPITQNQQNDGSIISQLASTIVRTTSNSDLSSTEENVPPPIKQMHISDYENLPSSSIHHEAPLLLKGWMKNNEHDIEQHNNYKPSTKGRFLREKFQLQSFRNSFGNYTFYVKDDKVQTLQDSQGQHCIAPATSIIDMMTRTRSSSAPLLFFTNNIESPLFMSEIRKYYDIPSSIQYDRSSTNDGFHVFSAMTTGSSHSFHFHDSAQIYQIHGRKMWYFLPPSTPSPSRINACRYLMGDDALPKGARKMLQDEGDLVVFPKGWYHATCALDEWTVAVGMQKGSPQKVDQNFETIEQFYVGGGDEKGSMKGALKKRMKRNKKIHPMPWTDKSVFHRKMVECGVQFDPEDMDSWIWFNGDVGKFYNILVESDNKRNPKDIKTYAVHRWMGKDRSTLIHYHLIFEAIEKYLKYYPQMKELEGSLREKTRSKYEDNLGRKSQYGRNKDSNDNIDNGDGEIGEVDGKSEASRRTKGDNMKDDTVGLQVFDAGCGLGAGLMWFETNPSSKTWEMVGHTISEIQVDFIKGLPKHKFRVELKSYDDLEDHIGKNPFDVIYSIEAFIHSPDGSKTLQTWSNALAENGLIILIDDFLSVGVDKNADDIQLFAKSWMTNTLFTTTELIPIANKNGLELVLDRDLGSEYEIIKNNYRNKLPDIEATEAKSHQGWLGSKIRQRLMVQGKLTYRMIVLRKKTSVGKVTKSKAQIAIESRPSSAQSVAEELSVINSFKTKKCTSVQTTNDDNMRLDIKPIKSQHRTGRGKDGGEKQACISGWYCCGKGQKWLDNLEANRTSNTAYLKLDPSLFGNYMDSIVHHLNKFYGTLSRNAKGTFLDIGGAGSVASGMKQVTSKFSHFSGPFDYVVLDSDPKAKDIQNVVFCDMSNCSVAEDCAYDVTFSHTVLEHTPRPWEAFNTIARVTKKGGLSIHVVPFSYQYHATPDDNYRFSHKALTSLMEDRGFEVLQVGYDICEKPEKVLKTQVDEHFDVIWLSFVIAKKK